jgi:hypothetical protein
LFPGLPKRNPGLELANAFSVVHRRPQRSAIMRAFVKLRQLLASNEELNRKFAAVIRKLATHDKYFAVVFDELKKLNELPTPSRKQIGFKTAS